MARERELIEEIRQFERPKYEVTQSTHADVIVDTLVEFLRQCFFRHPNYPYIPRDDSFGPDFANTKIVIVDKYTEDALFLPTITTNIDGIQTQWIQFSQSPFATVLKPQYNPDGSIMRDSAGRFIPSHYEYTGAYNATVSLLISASDTIEREELANLLHVVLAESGRDTLYMRGIFVKNVTLGGASEVEYRNDYIFQQTVTLDIYSEWKRKIPVGDNLESIGYMMNVDDGTSPPPPPATIGHVLPIYNLESTPWVIDLATGNPTLVRFLLEAQLVDAPVTLTYNAGVSNWVVSTFWEQVLEDTLIPWENLAMDLLKANPAEEYIKHAAAALLQASAARSLAMSQGQRLADGTVVVNSNTFVYTNGRVELKNFDPLNPLIYSTIVEGDDEVNGDARDTVIFRLTKQNVNKSVLVVKNLVLDSDGNPTSGDLFRRISSGDVPLTSSLDTPPLLDGSSYDTMTAVDLLLILQFAEQPYRYSLSQIIDEIDKVLEQLADLTKMVSYRMAKMTSLTVIKQQLIERSDRFLLRRPLGL